MELIFASHNQHKVKEIQSLIGVNFTIKSLTDINYQHEIIENGKTLQENALIKARTIYQHTLKNCFADDTGLLVESLNNEPGVYSARYAGPAKNDQQNMELLLTNLAPHTNRKAAFVTVIALILNKKEYLFEGKLEGIIAQTPTGINGFGYDPIFIPKNQTITLAQMSLEEKNTISHRAIAFHQLVNFLQRKI